MDTNIFLNNLKEFADRYSNSPQNSGDFFNYIDNHYNEFIQANPAERKKIRSFIKGGLFNKNKIAFALLMYVKDRVLPNLKSTKDEAWLVRGLVAISMENRVDKFLDKDYMGAYPKADAQLLLADLYVTSEEVGINRTPIFEKIADISDTKGVLPMNELMQGKYIGKLVHERKTEGKFIGLI